MGNPEIYATTWVRINMNKYPKIKSVKSLENKKLEIIFEGDIKKIYDCSLILNEEPFIALKNNALFNNVHVDPAGYGVSWNDQIDLSESELWINGKNLA